jgi:hypothetical protein
LAITAFKLKPDTIYRVYLDEQNEPIGALKTNPNGMGAIATVGPVRGIDPTGNKADTNGAPST